mmetsp:Transcript_50960/g.103626  ORF Transcript_50960/g.103626 Transcript_50960/m.103626 type:complete len:96 (+) Transcript_50960:900-1187(+)
MPLAKGGFKSQFAAFAVARGNGAMVSSNAGGLISGRGPHGASSALAAWKCEVRVAGPSCEHGNVRACCPRLMETQGVYALQDCQGVSAGCDKREH